MNVLTEEEQKELVRLMDKISLPTSLPIFEAWCRVFGTVCAEVVILRNIDTDPEIFLMYREDNFFKGWHIPGRVHLPTETIKNTIQRVLHDECEVTSQKVDFFGWFERSYGNGREESARGHEFSLTFIAISDVLPKENDIARFFPLRRLPQDIIGNQLPIMQKLLEKFKNL